MTAAQDRGSTSLGWEDPFRWLEIAEPVPAEFSDWEGEIAHRSFLIAHPDVPIESWVTCTTVELDLDDLKTAGSRRSTDLVSRLRRAADGRRTPPLCLQDFRGHTTEGAVAVAHLRSDQFDAIVGSKVRDSGEGGPIRLQASSPDPIAKAESQLRNAAVFPDWANPGHDLWISTEVRIESDADRGNGRRVRFNGDVIARFHLRINILQALESRAGRIMTTVLQELVPTRGRSWMRRWFLDQLTPISDPSERLLASERDLLLGKYVLGRATSIRHWQFDEPVWEWIQERAGLDESSAQRSSELQLAQELVAAAARRRVVGASGTSALAIVGLNVLTLISTWATFLQVVPRPGFPEGVDRWIGRSSLEVVSVLALGGIALLLSLAFLLARWPVRSRRESVAR
jgi:hypothetical protein